MSNTPFKMKGSPMKRNFGIPSPVKDTGAEYNEKAKAESPSGRGLSSKTIKQHDDMHATKWKPGTHDDKDATPKKASSKAATEGVKHELTHKEI